DSLRHTLEGMRADQLLAASLANSLSGFYETLDNGLASTTKAKSIGVVKALDETSGGLVYTPVTPCRLVETRAGGSGVYHGGGAFSAGETRTYVVEGGNGNCLPTCTRRRFSFRSTAFRRMERRGTSKSFPTAPSSARQRRWSSSAIRSS